MQQAEIVCDSYGEHSPRLTTFRVRQFRFIHSEFLRHKMLPGERIAPLPADYQYKWKLP